MNFMAVNLPVCTGVFLWSLMELALGFCNFVGTAVGIDLQPGMQMPLLSTSLREFWGYRWNLPTTDILRAVCYSPLAGLHPSKAAGNLEAPMTRKSARALLAARTVEHPDAAAVQQRHEVYSRNGAHRRKGLLSSADGACSESAKVVQNHSNSNTRAMAHSQSNEGKEEDSAVRRFKLSQTMRKQAAMMATFACSGVIHQWIQHVMFSAPHTEWRWAFSFLLQPVLIVMQDAWQSSYLWRLLFGWSPALLRCASII
jgi:hypothetical protein